jgi:peptidyl-prolyl cis-trans isomerase A (cyclophilin A)
MGAMNILSRRVTCLGIVGTILGMPLHAAQPATAPAPVAAPAQTTTVILQTSLGDIHIALDTLRAPKTAKNFLAYVDAGRFNGITFYRAMHSRSDGSEGLVQGGMRGELRGAFPPVEHESTVATGLSHVDGAISMARGNFPGSARAEFFIIVGGLPNYDGEPRGDPGYAVFGKVTKGMNVVRRILRMPTSPDANNPMMSGQMLVKPVTIVAAKRAP